MFTHTIENSKEAAVGQYDQACQLLLPKVRCTNLVYDRIPPLFIGMCNILLRIIISGFSLRHIPVYAFFSIPISFSLNLHDQTQTHYFLFAPDLL